MTTSVFPKLQRLIQRRRRHVRLNLPGLAQRIGMSVSDLCHLEEGYAPWPGAARIGEIARALECAAPQELFEVPGMMPVNTPTADAAAQWLRHQAADHPASP